MNCDKHTHGLIVVAEREKVRKLGVDPIVVINDHLCVAHYVGYFSEPTSDDKAALLKELAEDSELGLTGLDDMLLLPSPEELVDQINSALK